MIWIKKELKNLSQSSSPVPVAGGGLPVSTKETKCTQIRNLKVKNLFSNDNDEAEIQNKLKKYKIQFHPDKNQDCIEDATTLFQNISIDATNRINEINKPKILNEFKNKLDSFINQYKTIFKEGENFKNIRDYKVVVDKSALLNEHLNKYLIKKCSNIDCNDEDIKKIQQKFQKELTLMSKMLEQQAEKMVTNSATKIQSRTRDFLARKKLKKEKEAKEEKIN